MSPKSLNLFKDDPLSIEYGGTSSSMSRIRTNEIRVLSILGLFCNFSFFSTGNSFKIGFQTSVNGSLDQTDPAFDEVPHVVGGHPQILAAGRLGRRGCGSCLRISRHDGRAEPGQRNDGHRKTARLRGNLDLFSQGLHLWNMHKFLSWTLSCPQICLNWFRTWVSNFKIWPICQVNKEPKMTIFFLWNSQNCRLEPLVPSLRSLI